MLPLQVLAPMALDGPAAIVSMLNPTGGLVGGDRLDITVDVGEHAHACLVTPSATKVYRTTGDPAEQHVHLDVGAGALCEWIPDHTIPFPGSALRQALVAELATDAALIVVDAFAAGRVARGETWEFSQLESTVSIRDDVGWLFHDRFALRGRRQHAELGVTEGQAYFGTVVVIGAGDVAEFIRAVTAVTDQGDANVAAAALPRRGAAVRVLAGQASGFLTALDHVWTLARRLVLDAPALSLRKS